jgi:hypothetical protein
MNQKTIQAAALEALALEPGDRVRVCFKVPSHTGGWKNSWNEYMNKAVGTTMTIHRIDLALGVAFKECAQYFPAFCLEVVERAPKVPAYPGSFSGHTVRYVQDRNVLKVGCQEFTFADILNIQDDLEELGYPENFRELQVNTVTVRGTEVCIKALRKFIEEGLKDLVYYMDVQEDMR